MISLPDLKTLLLGILLDASSFSIHFLGEKSLKRRTARNLFNKKKLNNYFKVSSVWFQLMMLRNI
jgi:hypothetical protein